MNTATLSIETGILFDFWFHSFFCSIFLFHFSIPFFVHFDEWYTRYCGYFLSVHPSWTLNIWQPLRAYHLAGALTLTYELNAPSFKSISVSDFFCSIRTQSINPLKILKNSFLISFYFSILFHFFILFFNFIILFYYFISFHFIIFNFIPFHYSIWFLIPFFILFFISISFWACRGGASRQDFHFN